jgi:hypothetical protein
MRLLAAASLFALLATGGKLKVTSQKPLTVLGHPGREITAEGTSGRLRMRIFVGDRYFYQMLSAGATLSPDTEKFFAGFRLLK